MERNEISEGNYAVIFSYKRSDDLTGYQEMDDLTMRLAAETPGYLGYEVTGDGTKHAIFISYWQNEEAINAWRNNITHQKAKQLGKSTWYDWYHSMICKIENSNFKDSSNG
jgi:heme-degrading monooxygenase HmoA